MLGLIQNIPSQPGESNECFTKYPGSSSCLPQSMNLTMLLQYSEVEHGRNHLITGQLCEPLTSTREFTINVNDSQGTLVQSTKCE